MLIELAKHMREADRRGETLGLTDAEVAFYDALETNHSAVKVSATRPFGTSTGNWWWPIGRA